MITNVSNGSDVGQVSWDLLLQTMICGTAWLTVGHEGILVFAYSLAVYTYTFKATCKPAKILQFSVSLHTTFFMVQHHQ